VKYFKEFVNSSNTRADLIELLMRSEGYVESGCKTRVSQAHRIIRAGMEKEALKIIARSEGVPVGVADMAKQLMVGI
jgi:hypothetical protein